MLTRFKFFFYTLMVSAALSACSGEDGDPGPKGDQGEQGEQGAKGDQGPQGTPGEGAAVKVGFIEGTVAGIRRDGTPFSEAFKYEYTYNGVQAFDDDNGKIYFSASRFLTPLEDGPSLYMELRQVSEGVFEPADWSGAIDFDFQKELNNDDLFIVDAQPYFAATEAYVSALGYDYNEKYNFTSTSSPGGIHYDEVPFNGTPAYQLGTYVSNLGWVDIFYSKATGSLLGLHKEATSEDVTSGELFNLYNEVKFKDNATHGMPVFYNAANNAEMFSAFPDVPADELSITNFTRNATTGVITFDFVIKVSQYLSTTARENSTGHDVTITGKYNSGGKVYKNIIARERN